MKRVLLACFIPFVACLCSAVLAAEAPIQNLKSKAESARPAKQIQNPNLLILLTDDQRWDAMGCAGNRIVRTPEMDRLAREGTLFVNAFVTSSICAASR
ncbi:MAG: hypothetical protein FJ388_11680, partial [Verrucomicrobia bacterium]|nr:hypothetical protein [Verrucomicrobiota bacterium]